MKYEKITDNIMAKVENGRLYVKFIDGVLNRTYVMKYSDGIRSAKLQDESGISDIDRCIWNGAMILEEREI